MRHFATASVVLLLSVFSGCGDTFEEPALDPGKGFEIKRISGTVEVDLVGAAKFELKNTTRAPNGARVDTRKGAAEITAAVPGGGEQAARLSAGEFSLEGKQDGALTEITLLGKTCDDPRGGTTETRRLFGEGEGSFRTRGRFGAAGVRGTRWGVRDRCDGTLIVARRGTVIAEDFLTGRKVTLRAPKSYLARAG